MKGDNHKGSSNLILLVILFGEIFPNIPKEISTVWFSVSLESTELPITYNNYLKTVLKQVMKV